MQNIDLLNIITKWKYKLGIIATAAIILSGVFSSSFFITPKYKSTAVIYPSNLTPYSQESVTEQMIQLFQSDSIFNHVVNHFSLIKHYGIDSASKTLRNELLGIWNENVSIKKTDFEAVKIDALDKDPFIACGIINEMINAFNRNTLRLNWEKSKELADDFTLRLKAKQKQIDSINTEMKELAVKYGIIDYEMQSKELAREYYRTLGTGNEKKIADLTNALRNLEEKGGQFHELKLHLKNSTNEYALLLTSYNTFVSDSKKELTYTNVVVKPVPADKKSYPVRWIIVAVATCATLFFSIIVIVILEGRKK